MRQGELRQKIIDECPEEFLTELSGWIDDLESLLRSASNHLEIDGVGDLHKIEDAKTEVENILGGLY